VQSRLLRAADLQVAWFDGALVAARENAERLHHLAGAGLPVPGTAEAAPSRPLAQQPHNPPQPAGPNSSRPLAPSTPLDRPARDGRMRPTDGGTLAELAPYGTNGDGAPATSGPLGGASAADPPYAPGSLRAVDLLGMGGMGDAGGSDSLGNMTADFFAEQEPERRDEA